MSVRRNPLRFCWPIFRIYDEEGHVGLAWRRPWYRRSSFHDIIGVQYDLTQQFDRWLKSLDEMTILWPNITPRDPMIHSTPERNTPYRHEWIEDDVTTP